MIHSAGPPIQAFPIKNHSHSSQHRLRKPVTKKASKACLHCRSRKTRCDATTGGIPCTNCKWIGNECVMLESNRKRTHKIAYQRSAPLLSEETSQQLQESTSLLHLDLYPTLGDASMHSDISHYLNLDAPAGLSFHQLATINDALPDHPMQFNKDWPQYIHPLPSKVSPVDYQYLKSKDALTIPGISLRDALLQAFTLFVHPFLPAVDVGQVIAKIQHNTGSRISLLLFQALMHSAIPYVDIKLLQEYGYKNKRQASEAFFKRAELLYKFDTETNPLTLVQSLLLMSLQCEGRHGNKDTWHYIGIAISIAQSIESDNRAAEIPPSLWKRVLWSCYMRDQITALTMQRPMRITARDFRIPALTADDFEPFSLHDEIITYHRDTGTCLISPLQWDALIEICIALTNICRTIGYLLDRQYTSKCNRGSMDGATARIVPRERGPATFNVLNCHTMLEEWHRGLRDDLKWHRQESPVNMETRCDTAIRIHRAVLQSIYLVAKSALHSPQLIRPGHKGPKRFSQTRVHEAATGILDIFSDLHSWGCIAHLPEVGAAVLQPAIIDCLYNMKSRKPWVREVAIANFQFCTRILHQMSGTYAVADSILSLAAAGIKKVRAMTTNVNNTRSGYVKDFTPSTGLPSSTLMEKSNRGLNNSVSLFSENSLLQNVRITAEERSFLGGLLAHENNHGPPISV